MFIVTEYAALKVFYKGYYRQSIGCFMEILTKIKSKLTSHFLVFLSDPYLLIYVMIDEGMKKGAAHLCQ